MIKMNWLHLCWSLQAAVLLGLAANCTLTLSLFFLFAQKLKNNSAANISNAPCHNKQP